MVSSRMLRLLLVSAVFFVLVISSAANVAAAEKPMNVRRITAVKDSGQADAFVFVSLESKKSLADSRIVVSIPEAGIRAGRKVDFSKSGKKTVHLEIPVPDMFDPYVRVVLSSEQGRRIRHRPVLSS
ncbi:hypothetical protein HYU17_02275 [Candidatus Woesearchaeota archaeon]|nr:hypothetical protein [Candidatus Woesearchaeota archaeon]